MLETPGYAFGPFRLIPARRLLLRDGQPIPLTPRAFDTLVTLVERHDRLVTKEELLDHVWQGVAVEEANLSQQVFLLRRALDDSASGEHYIATVPRRGYRFVQEVELLPADVDGGRRESPVPARLTWRRGATAAGALVLVAVVAYAMLIRGRTAETIFTLTQLTRDAGIESFPSVSPDGREFVYASGPLDYFGESDIYRRDVGLQRPSNLTPDSPGADTQPAFSPDGTLIAFRSERDGGGIFLMARDGSGVRPLTAEGFNPAWAPDGHEIAYATVHTMASPFANAGDRSALRAVDVRTGVTRTLRETAAAQPSWSPRGSRIAYWSRAGISTCAPDGSDEQTVVRRGPEGYHWNPVWSPDGAFLYFSSNRNGVMHLWRVRMDERSGRASGDPEPAPIPMPSTFVGHANFAPDGRLLFASMPITASVERVPFDMTSGTVRGERMQLTPPALVSVWPEPSPDGNRIAFHVLETDAEVGAIYVSSADGTKVQPLTQEPASDRVPRWSPDGRRIAFYSTRSGRSNIWTIDADGRNLRQITHSTSAHVLFPVWSPDGRRIAASEAPLGRSYIFDVEKPWEDGNLLLLPRPGPGTQFVPWSWSTDGHHLAGFLRPTKGIVVFSLASRTYRRLTEQGSTPVWMPDGERLLYAVNERLMIVDVRSGVSREVLNAAPGRIEVAAGGGFSLSPTTGHLYLSPSLRGGDIWLAAPGASR